MWKDKAMRLLMVSAASTSICLVVLIFFFLARESAPFIVKPGLGALFDTQWIPVSFIKERFGLLPLITGSALVTGLSMLFTIPLSVLGAIYIAEIASPVEREFLKPFIELLASIPSVVLGFFGLMVLAPLIKHFFGLGTGLTALTGAFLLTLMAIPTVITLSEDAINSVPRAYKDASQALGASDLQTIFQVIIPAALPGIIAAIMLGTGRVIGETMAVLMVTGNSALMTWSPLAPVRTMTATIAAEMGEVSFGSIHYHSLFWIGLVLLAVTFILNIIAQRVLVRYGMMK